SQFLVSLRKLHSASIVNLIMASAWLFWSLYHFGPVPIENYFLGLFVIPCSVIIFYSIRFSLTATSLLFTNAENLQFIWYSFYKLGTRPDVLYKPWLRYILMSFIPVGIINSFPARLLMESDNLWLAPWAIFISILLLYLSHKYWNFCLKHYSSASS
nr:ABC-2 family transporter protein [Pseudobdellovibrionaceae bacterium]